MTRLDRVGVITGVRFGLPMAHAVMVVDMSGAAPVLRVLNAAADETVRLALSGSGLATIAGFDLPGANRVALAVNGLSGSIPRDLLGAAQLAAQGGVASAVTGFLTPGSAHQAQAVGLVAATVGGVSMLVATRPAGSGLEVFRINPDQSLTRLSGQADTPALPLANLSAMATVAVGGTTFVYTGSASEDGLALFHLGATGALTLIDTLTPAHGLQVQTITALRTVDLAGQPFLLAAAAGSSSLTVFRIGPDGRLTATDHVFDELATRFQGVTALDVVVAEGRAYVLAAGADQGITLFALTPDGRLVHLLSLADTLDTGLAGISAIKAVVVGQTLQIMVLSGAEAGLTQLSLNLATMGQVVTASNGLGQGGPLADIILDSASSDSLTGGAGADVFVPMADGRRDVITDFDPQQDRIDLGFWPFFRSAAQLTVTPTATGAILDFFGEVLEIITATRTPLTEAQVRAMILSSHGRLALTLGPPLAAASPLNGTASDDMLTGTAAADLIEAYGGRDVVFGYAGDDSLYGGAGEDSLSGAEGRDLLDGGEGNDSLDGGAQDDTLIGGAGRDWTLGGAGNDLHYGGDGDDTLLDMLGDDSILGEAGHDNIMAGVGNDCLSGGTGNDSLNGMDGADTLFGGTGADFLVGGAGDDWIEGGDDADWIGDGDGNDTTFGGAVADYVHGGAGNDLHYGGEGDDFLFDAQGDDSLYGGAGRNIMVGGQGADLIIGGPDAEHGFGGAGRDYIALFAGDDILFGLEDADHLDGGDGRDTLDGGTGDDTLLGGFGADILAGAMGDDFLFGEAGDDTISGGAGHDQLFGGDGADFLFGEAGIDVMMGGAGDDFLSAGEGSDQLFGGSGRDTLIGGLGSDTLVGGAGADQFLFGSFTPGEADFITDFEDGIDCLRLLGLPGATAQAMFANLRIDDVVLGGTAYARIQVGGHFILIGQMGAAHLGIEDFLFT